MAKHVVNFSKYMMSHAYYPQLGMMQNDLIRDRYPEVLEAIKRMPKELQDARQARRTRAFYLDARKMVLPKEEWMTPDKEEKYLEPYLAEVLAEVAEKKAWEDLELTWRKDQKDKKRFFFF